ncbi:cellulose biosynthesis protein BcsQ [Zhongshania arctica]|uniref:Cellulose biosynthesis protein BcsQ n=1 Tax=Zhongshania arctica TaxID=3238302 RepID=A0ABV3TWI1_9GAMM
MPVVIVSGQRGGVGTTTVVSNLAAALQRAGEQTLSLDLHSDNQLCVNFGVDQELTTGWGQAVSSGKDWKQCAFQAVDGRRVLPFGDVPPYQYSQFREGLASSVTAMAASLSASDGDWLLVDMPVDRQQALCDNPTARIYEAIYALADISLYVINPDLACYRLLKQAALAGESLDTKQFYLINGLDTDSSLSMDIELLLQAEYSKQILPVSIHLDAAVPEAAAFMSAVNAYMPDSQASGDYHSLALWCIGHLSKGDADV